MVYKIRFSTQLAILTCLIFSPLSIAKASIGPGGCPGSRQSAESEIEISEDLIVELAELANDPDLDDETRENLQSHMELLADRINQLYECLPNYPEPTPTVIPIEEPECEPTEAMTPPPPPMPIAYPSSTHTPPPPPLPSPAPSPSLTPVPTLAVPPAPSPTPAYP